MDTIRQTHPKGPSKAAKPAGLWAAGLAVLSLLTVPSLARAANYANFQLDVTVLGPSVLITAPADGATVSGSSVAVSASAADAVGVQFKLDGVNLGAEDVASPFGLVWDSTTTTDGAHTITAVARDGSGNTNSHTITVNVNNAPPAVSTVTIAHTVVSPIYFNGFISVPVTVTVDDGILDAVRLYYRKKGDADYVLASGANAFPPVSSNSRYTVSGATDTTYTGAATVPGDVITALGVEYYIEAFAVSGSSDVFGTAASPNFVQYIPQYEAVLSADGGTFVLPDGNPNGGHTSLLIPPGIITSNMTLVMRQLRNEEVSSLPQGTLSPFTPPLVAFEFSLGGLHRFSKPIFMTLMYKKIGPNGEVLGLTGIDENKLRIFWWDGFDWRFMGGQVNTAMSTVSTLTSHFSIFAVFPVGGVPPQTYRPKEKIITPNGDGTNDVAIFSGLSGNFDLKIFDITGRHVRTVHTVAEWDGRDDGNKLVENGTYIYQFRPVDSTEWVSGLIGVAK